MRPSRMLVAGLIALLTAVSGTAFAETDVVLSNESEGTTVTTGDATFTNVDNASSSSGVSSAGDAASGTTQGVTDLGAGATERVANAVDESNTAAGGTQSSGTEPELLFVGAPISTTIGP